MPERLSAEVAQAIAQEVCVYLYPLVIMDLQAAADLRWSVQFRPSRATAHAG